MEEPKNTAENTIKEIFKRVANHSDEFDRHISETRLFSQEEIIEAWQVREWKIGDTTVKAIGVSHVPETFLEFRQQIEKSIEESDVVVNEFAPEALGFYDQESTINLRSTKSRFNNNYNLEELRQAYLVYERQYNLGLFHHEIELLAAKYGKDMAIADLSLSKSPEAFLQSHFLYAYGAEQIEEREAALKKMGLYAGSVALGMAGLSNFLKELETETPTISRRQFLKLGISAGAAIALAQATPKIVEAPQLTTLKETEEQEGLSDDEQIEMLRDPKLADALLRLSESGYKKIAFIYGTDHLKIVEAFLDNPGERNHELTTNQELIERNNPDAFRVYHLTSGENKSERFVASEKMVWKQISQIDGKTSR
jgi:hypothetical protein